MERDLAAAGAGRVLLSGHDSDSRAVKSIRLCCDRQFWSKSSTRVAHVECRVVEDLWPDA